MIGSIITEVSDSLNFSDFFTQTEESMPVVLLDNDVVLPFTPQTIEIKEESTLKILQKKSEDHKPVFVGFKTANKGERIGTICKVLRVIDLPDRDFSTVFLLPGPRALLRKMTRTKPIPRGIVEIAQDIANPKDAANVAALESVRDVYFKIIEQFSDNSRELKEGLKNTSSFSQELFFMVGNSPLNVENKYNILKAPTFSEQALLATGFLSTTQQLMQLKAEIQKATHEELSRQQKEHYLRQQLNTIQNELGGLPEEVEEEELRKKAQEKNWDKSVADHFNKELRKLERFNMQSPEYAIQYNYLETLLALPWRFISDTPIEIGQVEEVLNRDHYGLEKVKERILEQVAVLQLRKDMKAPILCLYGPPGVGKTSLGKSVAEALGREYCRISLGGLHDEAEIRGHRRTYIGAMPGRIISAMKKCGTSNPVFVLDEIDKIGKDFKGDPSTALLEVLDPEQNVKFHDNYIDIDYDLSKVMFIATANDLSGIARPLLDRMELVNISGYVTEEKQHIAQNHLIPRQLKEHGFEPEEIQFTTDGIIYLIDHHTRESGVRQLDKAIGRVFRKVARLKVSGKDYPNSINAVMVADLLGQPEINPEEYEGNDIPGVVTGLAWTQAGGEILFVESSLSKGKGKLELTGNLGDVMKESAIIALQYLKSHAEEFKIPEEKFTNFDIHIHVPEGAVPKDGPSAGITMVTSLASTFSNRKVRPRLAMTGEITLRGKITPVGGVKEKILAAKRAGITDIILCQKNRKDIEEIKPEYIEGLSFHYFDRIADALSFALV